MLQKYNHKNDVIKRYFVFCAKKCFVEAAEKSFRRKQCLFKNEKESKNCNKLIT